MTLTRRDLLRSAASAAASSTLPSALRGSAKPILPAAVEQWDAFETQWNGPSTGNPFRDVTLRATFTQESTTLTVDGFYDGGGVYRIRFMPSATGTWSYRTASNHAELDGHTGAFTATAPSHANHGPVRVVDRYRFAYADGKPFREVGTTCYAWTCQPAALEDQTLATLRTAPFNKLRMCVFPKWFNYNHVEPPAYPFAGQAPDHWHFERFNPAYFQHLEQRIRQLRELGIEADLILFHPYDAGHWGFDTMGAENDAHYLRYLIARLGACRNVWWSVANEWDYFKTKSEADFERIGETIAALDPYKHLCSIHNQTKFFDHTRPWITHVSVQNDMPDNAPRYLRQYGKPVIFDECRYEGDIPEGWGDITSERLVGNFWKTLVSGAWCGHGETYLNPREELWWSKGGVMVGQSPARLAFFRSIIDAAPPSASLLPERNTWGTEGEFYLTYLWDRQHASQHYKLPSGNFTATIIDTLAMTLTPVPGLLSGSVDIPLPVRPYLAVRVIRA